MSAKTALIEALTKIGYEEGKTLFLQGSVNPEVSYPPEFVTFWTEYTSNVSQFDNATYRTAWNMTVILYANDSEIVNTKPAEIIAALEAAGFVCVGKGEDILSDEETHTGWAMEFIFQEDKEF